MKLTSAVLHFEIGNESLMPLIKERGYVPDKTSSVPKAFRTIEYSTKPSAVVEVERTGKSCFITITADPQTLSDVMSDVMGDLFVTGLV